MALNGNGWHPTAIVRAILKLDTATRTVRVDTDAGEGFLKALGNPEGPHVLACELVGSLAADWLGLITLDFALIEVTDPDEVVISGMSYAAPGPAFISRAEDKSLTWGGDGYTLTCLTDPERSISGLVVLDTWLRNCDRHSPDGRRINLRNVFLAQKTVPQRKLELVAMDFTHAFTCGHALDRRLGFIDRIKDTSVFGLFPEFRNFMSPLHVGNFATRLAAFTVADARSFIQQVPTEWRIEPEVRAAWARFLIDRAHFLAEHIENMLFPQNAQFDYSGE